MWRRAWRSSRPGRGQASAGSLQSLAAVHLGVVPLGCSEDFWDFLTLVFTVALLLLF